jgi:hypothetical protein
VQTLGDNKVIVRKQIGSRPPKCDTRCRFWGHFEVIEVPANPRAMTEKINPSTLSTIAYARRQDNSNYKPFGYDYFMIKTYISENLVDYIQ